MVCCIERGPIWHRTPSGVSTPELTSHSVIIPQFYGKEEKGAKRGSSTGLEVENRDFGWCQGVAKEMVVALADGGFSKGGDRAE